MTQVKEACVVFKGRLYSDVSFGATIVNTLLNPSRFFPKKTSKNFLASAILLSVACLIPGEAFARNRDFRIVNNADYKITHFYVSPVDATSWGPDRLGSSTVRQGSTFFVDLDNRGEECHFDFKAVYENGGYDRGTRNLCQISEIEFYGSPDYD